MRCVLRCYEKKQSGLKLVVQLKATLAALEADLEDLDESVKCVRTLTALTITPK